MSRKVTPAMLVAGLRKSFGQEAAMRLGESNLGVKSVSPTGSEVLDRHVLGVGGLPRGRIIELYGGESAGKTTLMNRMIASAQADGALGILCETEHSYDPEWAKFCGVNTDDIVLLQPNYLDGKDGAVGLIAGVLDKIGDQPALIAYDSVAATQSLREFKEGITGDTAMCEAARTWSEAMRILSPKLATSNATLLLINQVRDKPGVMYGPTETTPGGRAIKFYASVRLAVSHGKKTPEGNGRFMNVIAMKNKVAPPYRKVTLRLDFDTGFNERWSILNHAKEMGCIDNKCRSLKDAVSALGWTDLLEKVPDAEEASESQS